MTLSDHIPYLKSLNSSQLKSKYKQQITLQERITSIKEQVLVQSEKYLILNVSLSFIKTGIMLCENGEIFYKCAVFYKLLNRTVAKDKVVLITHMSGYPINLYLNNC